MYARYRAKKQCQTSHRTRRKYSFFFFYFTDRAEFIFNNAIKITKRLGKGRFRPELLFMVILNFPLNIPRFISQGKPTTRVKHFERLSLRSLLLNLTISRDGEIQYDRIVKIIILLFTINFSDKYLRKYGMNIREFRTNLPIVPGFQKPGSGGNGDLSIPSSPVCFTVGRVGSGRQC